MRWQNQQRYQTNTRDNAHKIPGGFELAISSTSKGIMTDRRARQEGVGGEVLGFFDKIYIR
jgi:ribosomal protein S8